MTAHDPDRAAVSSEDQDYRAIRDGMDRLLKGEPIRSDGSLTAVALADESGVARWKLYEDYRYLLDEFRTRAARQEVIPEDPAGPITVRRFRRTVAREIQRRPFGRIANGVLLDP